MKKNVLLLETIADEAFKLLEEAQNIHIVTAYGDKPLNEILAEHDIDAVITRGKGQVNKQLMAACPNLKVAARCGVGLDNVDVKEATARNIIGRPPRRLVNPDHPVRCRSQPQRLLWVEISYWHPAE